MNPLDWLRKAAPLGLPILASITAVILLQDGYSVSRKMADYERLRADHEALVVTVTGERREAEEAASNLARLTGDLSGANENMRRVTTEREIARQGRR